MSRNVNLPKWLKTIFGNFASMGRLALKPTFFTIKLFLWASVRVYVGIVLLFVVFLLSLTPLDLTDSPIANRWLDLAVPITFGVIVGVRISLENYRKHGTTTLRGLEKCSSHDWRRMCGGDGNSLRYRNHILAGKHLYRNVRPISPRRRDTRCAFLCTATRYYRVHNIFCGTHGTNLHYRKSIHNAESEQIYCEVANGPVHPRKVARIKALVG